MTTIDIRTIAIILLSSLSILKTAVIDKRSLKNYENPQPNLEKFVHKVILTQKGYIQFLEYIADVPIITEFTFCIWINSVNYTFSHPLLSYSKFDTESYIRGWITPGGKNLNLEILKNEIFSVPVDLEENKWYHICQSWSSSTGTYIAFRNGEAISMGNSQKMRLAQIPNGGRIVVGQEYTDFDKGLDDGVEGDIYGFNLVLASASSTLSASDEELQLLLHQNDLSQTQQQHISKYLTNYPRSMNIYNVSPELNNLNQDPNFEFKFTSSRPGHQIPSQTDVPEALNYFDTGVSRNPKRVNNFGKSVLNMFNLVQVEKPVRLKTVPELSNIKRNEKLNYGIYEYYAPRHVQYTRGAYNSPSPQLYPTKRILGLNNGIQMGGITSVVKPLGLLLVELGYKFCALGKGSPINDKRLLISWTKTPVRVFGGAILKTVVPFCER